MKIFKKIKYWSETPAGKDMIRYIKNGWKYLMIPAIVTNYCNVLYGGYLWIAFNMASAIFFAMASIVDNKPNFLKSIFQDLNPLFFCKELSWENKYKLPWFIPDGFSDFWHISMGAGILCLFIAAGLPKPDSWLETVIIGMYYHWTTFSLFYEIILRRKEKSVNP